VLRLLRRRRRRQLRLLAEAEVYARSYGQRSDEVSNVRPVERVALDAPDDAEAEELPPPARLNDRALRDAFLSRLARRREH
jgi:hypothetical protein